MVGLGTPPETGAFLIARKARIGIKQTRVVAATMKNRSSIDWTKDWTPSCWVTATLDRF